MNTCDWREEFLKMEKERDRLKEQLETLLKRFEERVSIIPDFQADINRIKAQLMKGN